VEVDDEYDNAGAVAKESFSRRRNGADSLCGRPDELIVWSSKMQKGRQLGIVVAQRVVAKICRARAIASLFQLLSNRLSAVRLDVDQNEVVCVLLLVQCYSRRAMVARSERASTASVERAIVEARLARKTPAQSDSESCGTQISPLGNTKSRGNGIC
jgi:hypothetical protein